MGRHDEARPGGDTGAERDELTCIERLAISREQRQLVVTVRGDVADAREVLQCRRDAGRLETANSRRDELAGGARVVAERSDPDRRVRRVRREVTDGAVV